MLQSHGIQYSFNEMIAIQTHDGLYDPANEKYLKGYMVEQKPRTSLVFVLHQADMMVARVEFEREWLPKLKGDVPKEDNFKVKSTNMHIAHLDDIILTENVDKVIDILNKIADKKLNTTIKFDGTPAIMFGVNPETNKFAVGTKRFTKTPAHSVEEINEIYDYSPELKTMLTDLFNAFSPHIKKGLYMGDLMWRPGQLKINKDVIEFKPNTLRYCAPLNSELGKKIKGTKYGLVIHTKLSGTILKRLSKSNDIDMNVFKNVKNVWVGDANISSYKNDQQQKDITNLKKEIAELKKYDETISELKLPLTKLSHIFMKLNFDNYSIQKKYDMMYDYFIDSYNSEKGKEKIKTIFSENKEKIIRFLQLNDKIIIIKHKIIDLLNESHLLSTTALINGKYESNSGEGFVALHEGDFIKLVNRTEFSKINKEQHKDQTISQAVADKIKI
jgi:hypothetical protein